MPFSLVDSESNHGVTLCVHSSFQDQDALLTGRSLSLLQANTTDYRTLGFYYFNWGRSKAVRSLSPTQALTICLNVLIINPFLQEEDTTNPH